MQLNFSYPLLITWVLFPIPGKTILASTSSNDLNIRIPNNTNSTHSQDIRALFFASSFLKDNELTDNIKLINTTCQTPIITSGKIHLKHNNVSNPRIPLTFETKIQRQQYIL